MQLVVARDGKTEQSIKSVFTNQEIVLLIALNKKLEGRTKKLQNPYFQDNLGYGSWVVARLGGWSGYKSQRPSGPITMLKGLIKFDNIFQGWILAQT